MLLVSLWNVAVTALVVCSVSAAPFSPSKPLAERFFSDCKSPQFGLSTKCWAELGLTQYVTQWWQKNGPSCQDRGFAPCFLASQGMATMQCDAIVNDACTPPNPKSFNDSRAFYVTYNIYAVNQFFNTYYNAIPAANTLALENIPAIIQTINPPKSQNVQTASMLLALSVGLSFLAPEAPEIMAVLNAAVQSVAISRFLFPEGTGNSQAVQLATVDQELGIISQQLQGNVSAVVPAILHDPAIFLNLTSGGEFSVAPNNTLFSNTQGLLKGLNTYVVSQALQANGIVVTRGLNTDINAFVQANSQNLNYDVSGCGNGYDAQGVCDAWWYDPGTNISFGLMNWNDAKTDYHDAMETIFTNWTSPANVFLAANDCHNANNSQNANNIISLTNVGINANCLSDMKVCTWDNDPNNWNTEFSDCDNEPSLHEYTCDATSGTKVPYSYIGPWMVDSTSLTVCR